MVSGGGKREKDRRRRGDAAGAYPASRLLVWHSSFAHARSRHAGVVRGHALNQQLEVVLPSAQAAELAAAMQWETSFYYEVRASLAMFLSPRFIAQYIAEGQGSMCMIAKNVAVDSHNSAMLLPTGELLLLVDAETYEQLGLVGHKYAQQIPADAQSALQHRRRRAQRYVISVDLRAPAFTSKEPHKYRDRVLHCLETKFEPLEMLVCAYNERGTPRTIIFGDDDTIERTRVDVNGQLDRFQNVAVPAVGDLFQEATPGANRMDMDAMRASLEDLYDWLGVVACRLTEILQPQQVPLEEYVSTFSGISDQFPTVPSSELSTVRWRGLIASEFVQHVLDKTREGISSGALPWAAVTVWGFPDAIVSWQQEYEKKRSKRRNGKKKDDTDLGETQQQQEIDVQQREHGFLVNGNNNYTFVLLPKDEYFVVQEVGPHDSTM